MSEASGSLLNTVLTMQLNDHVELAQATSALVPDIAHLGERMCHCFAGGGRVYTFGNGGSAADAQHLAAELVGRYKRDRRALPALAMTVDPSVLTCIGNDYDYDDVFSRQVEAFAQPGDLVIGFTTSGNSPNVVNGLAAARQRGATGVLFSAGSGGAAAQHAELTLLVPTSATARCQEMHLLLLHLLSEWIDSWAAGETDERGQPRSDRP